MLAELSFQISSIAVYMVGLPLLVGLINLKTHNKVQRTLFVVVLISAIVELAVYWVRKEETLQPILFYAFTVVEFNLLLYIYRLVLVPLVRVKWFWVLGVFLTCFVIVDMFWLSGFKQFNTYSTALESLLLILLTLIFFYKTLKELKIGNLERAPIFWISTAVLLYFSSSLFIFLFTNNVKSSLDALYILWGVHGVFNLLHYIFYSIALWLKTET